MNQFLSKLCQLGHWDLTLNNNNENNNIQVRGHGAEAGSAHHATPGSYRDGEYRDEKYVSMYLWL